MTSYDVISGDKSTLAVRINTTQTTGIQIAAMTINGTSTAWGNQSGVLEISEEIEGSLKREWISYTGGSTDSSNIFTPSGVSRDVARDASTLTGSGTGQSFNKGAVVKFVDFHYIFNQKADVDRVNTFTAAQTFGTGGQVLFSGTDVAGLTVKSLTTTQRDAIVSPVNGSIIYNSTTGVMNQYIGGAWTNFASGTTTNAANAASGKVDIATAAEIAAATATDATSGALNALVVGNTAVNAASGNWASGAIPALNTAKMVDGSMGGTGVASPVLGALLIGGGAGVAMTPIGPGSANQVPLSNGTTLAMAAIPTTTKTVYASGTSSATLTNPTSNTAYDTHTYAIPANDLVAGVGYEFECGEVCGWGAGTLTFSVMLGSTIIVDGSVGTPANGESACFRGTIMGTAAAGASVAVRGAIHVIGQSTSATNNVPTGKYATANVATNGGLTLQFGAIFSSSNGSNNTILTMATIKKISATAF